MINKIQNKTGFESVNEDLNEKDAHNPLIAVSLFSGAGGFDWGFHRAGFKTNLANELLETAAQTLAHNFKMKILKTPASPPINGTPQVIQGSIADVSFKNMNGFQPDVLIGGPPCQDYSVTRANQRKGLNGKKGKLYSHFIRTVVALHPKMFVFENVPGMVSANKGLAYQTILDDFSHLSQKQAEILGAENGQMKAYDYEILFNGIVDTTKFGVPQTRKRLIIIGLRQDLAKHFSESQLEQVKNSLTLEMNGGQSLIAKYPLTCMEIFEGKPLSELSDKYKKVMEAYEGIWEEKDLPSAINWRDEVWQELTLDVKLDYLAVNEIEEASSGEFQRAMEEHKRILETLGWLNQPVQDLKCKDGTHKIPKNKKSTIERMKRIPPDENHMFVWNTPWHVNGKGISFIYRRSFPLKPASTVMAYGGGGTYGYHYERTRSQLTLREKARIQTFTDDFLFTGKVDEIRAQIGEAVPPLMAEKIANLVRQILQRFESSAHYSDFVGLMTSQSVQMSHQ